MSSVIRPELTPTQESLFITLGIVALDSRLPQPFIGDTMADDIVKASGYDLTRFSGIFGDGSDPMKLVGGAVRTKRMDEIAARFVAAHPDAVVLDLGCGLDTRAFRVNPPSTVDWYDIDFGVVIDLRRQLIPHRDHTHVVAADLTDPGWLASIPADRPAMIIHHGLIPFLSMADYQLLLRRLVDHFPHGEIAHNSYTKLAVWAFKRYYGNLPGTGFNNPREPERWVPGLTLVEEIFNILSPEMAQAAQSKGAKLIVGLVASNTMLSRHLEAAVHRYRF